MKRLAGSVKPAIVAVKRIAGRGFEMGRTATAHGRHAVVERVRALAPRLMPVLRRAPATLAKPAVFLLSAAVGYYLALALVWSAYASGLALDLLSPLLAQKRAYTLQEQLRLMRHESRGSAAENARTLVVGDAIFVRRLNDVLKEPAKSIILQAPTLKSIGLALKHADLDRFDRVVLQNAPWYWSDVAVTAFGPAQSVRLMQDTMSPPFNVAGVKRLANTVHTALRWTKPYDDTQYTRPISLINVSFRSTASPKIKAALGAINKSVGPSIETVWVLDPVELPKDASPAFKSEFAKAFRSGTATIGETGRQITIDEISKAGEL